MNTSAADRFAALTGEQRIRVLRRLVEAGRLEEIPSVVPPRAADGPVRLSPAQEDLWVYESLYPDAAALNICCAYHFDGPVDVAALEAALTILHQNHDILRMRLVADDADGPRVTFRPPEPFVLERADLRGSGAALDDVLAEFGRRPFDLERDRLVRGRFVTVDGTRSALVLSLHHIVTDWWSFDVLHEEFSRTYQALREGRAPRHTRPPVQYADFASWQRELVESGVFDAQLDFWRGYLAGVPAPLRIGAAAEADHDRPVLGRIDLPVDDRTARAAADLARSRGTTLYCVLMTAFAVLAHRLSGESDLVIGTPMANRSAKGLERLVGFVMNTVPTRWRFADGECFAGLVDCFAGQFAAARANADVPLGRIAGATVPGRSTGSSPLFSWCFMHLAHQESVSALREIAQPRRVHTGGEYDLVGVTRDTGDGLEVSLSIATDVYPFELARHWAESFRVLLAGLLEQPEAAVARIPLLPGAERRAALAAGIAPPAPAGLYDRAARHAEQTPDAIAIEASDATLSYGLLIRWADRLAGRLAALGADRSRPVALCLPRGAALVTAMLAVERAGGFHLPVDPALPEQRIAALIRDADCAVVVTDTVAAGSLPDLPVPQVVWKPGVEDAAYAAVLPLADPRRAAYVMYTSGSTGRPKGVLVGHGGIAGFAAATVRGMGLNRDSRVLHLGSPGFDIAVGELCMAFGSGGTLVAPAPGTVAGPALGELLAQKRISAVLLTPTLLRSVPRGEYPDLTAIYLGGEACPADLVETWTAPSGRRLIRDIYGPTEGTVAATHSDPLDGTEPPPIGRPVDGTRVYVLDEHLQPTVVGARGEVYIGGAGVAFGYLGRPGATAERFVADPHDPRPGARMYRTGDLARRRPDGQLEFVGRADDQIKLRGVRIEPAEVEAALARHPDVAQAAVAVRETERGERILVGYLVPRQGATPDQDAVLSEAMAVLPAPMVPAALVVLTDPPRTRLGKLDRAALPAPAAASARPGAAPARAPRGPREEALCALFAELLDVPRVGPDDGFFALGGDSIAAIRLAGRARAAGLVFTPREVFTARTPAALALLARTEPTAGPAEADPGTGSFPATPIMRWWRERGGKADAFVMSALSPTPVGLDAERLRASLDRLAERHGTLRMRQSPASSDGRTGKAWTFDVPAASSAPGAIGLERVDASGSTDAEIREQASGTAATMRLDPESRMAAGVWFDAGPQRSGLLLLTVHHLAVDAVSWGILHEDLAQLLETGACATPPPPTSFRTWAASLPDQAARRTDQLDHWRTSLEGPEAHLLPAAAAAPSPTTGAKRAVHTASLPADRTAPLLAEVPAAFRCGTEEVLLTALLAAALRWRGSGSGLLVGLEGHGRDLDGGPDLSRTVGWFTSRHPVRLDTAGAAAEPFWAGGAETGQALKSVKEQLRSIPERGAGYGPLRYLNPVTGPVLAGLPAPDLGFNYLGRGSGAPGGAERLGLAAYDAVPLAHAVELDVHVEAAADGPRLTADWSYRADVLGKPEVRALADLWFAALGVLADHAFGQDAGGATASDFPLVELTQEQIDLFESEFAGDPR